MRQVTLAGGKIAVERLTRREYALMAWHRGGADAKHVASDVAFGGNGVASRRMTPGERRNFIVNGRSSALVAQQSNKEGGTP